MKKILFNDKYGLTKAVLDGRKTQTRRIIPINLLTKYGHNKFNDRSLDLIRDAPYKVGDIVAVAQSYESLNDSGYVAPEWLDHTCESSKGYKNKMFVRADLMPHRIRITDIRIEQLNDISVEDVYKEGFAHVSVNNNWGNASCHWEAMLVYYDKLGRLKTIQSPRPREAYMFLIDKLCGLNTWPSNPYVYVIEFELLDK